MAEKIFDGFDHTQYRDEVEGRWGKDACAAAAVTSRHTSLALAGCALPIPASLPPTAGSRGIVRPGRPSDPGGEAALSPALRGLNLSGDSFPAFHG
ncbi:hypothetical protein ACOM2C_09700 [Pseudarthrobacter sp. So.54]